MAAGIVETNGPQAVFKFSAGWGIPAFILTALLMGAIAAERRLTPLQLTDGD